MRSIAAIGVVSAVMVSIGAYIGLLDYWSKRPSVSVHIDNVGAVLPQPDEISLELQEMPNKYSDDLDIWALGLLRSLKDERSFDGLRKGLSELLTTFERRGVQLTNLISDLGELRLSVGQIDDLTLNKKLVELENKYVDVSDLHLIGLRARVSVETDVQQIDDEFGEVISAYGNRQIDSIISDLKDIEIRLENEKKRGQLQVTVTIENRSQIDNSLKRNAIMSVSVGTTRRSFDLQLLEESGVPHSSVVRKSLQSRPGSRMDDEDRSVVKHFVDDVKNEDLECEVVVMDIHGKIWASEKGQCENDGEDDLEGMKDYLQSSWRWLLD